MSTIEASVVVPRGAEHFRDRAKTTVDLFQLRFLMQEAITHLADLRDPSYTASCSWLAEACKILLLLLLQVFLVPRQSCQVMHGLRDRHNLAEGSSAIGDSSGSLNSDLYPEPSLVTWLSQR